MSYPPPQDFGGPPQGYGGFPQPGYGQEHPQGTTVLILGICSLVLCQILGPVAWVMGNNALKEIDAAPGRYSNRSNVNAGRICGMIASGLMIFSVVIGVLYFIFIIALVGASS